MEKTRTIKELYEILLNNYKSNSYYQKLGLCFAIGMIRHDGKINCKEENILRKSLKNNKPRFWKHKKFYNINQFNSVYWWPKGETKNRILFLEKMVFCANLPWYEKLWNILK